MRRVRGRRNFSRAIRNLGFLDTVFSRGQGEDFTSRLGSHATCIGAAATHGNRLRLQPLEGFDFESQFGDGASGGGLIEDFFLGGFDFVVRRFIQVLNILAIKGRKRGRKNGCKLPAPLEYFQFPQPAFQSSRRRGTGGSGEEARRRCRMVSAKPTVPARLSFSASHG